MYSIFNTFSESKQRKVPAEKGLDLGLGLVRLKCQRGRSVRERRRLGKRMGLNLLPHGANKRVVGAVDNAVWSIFSTELKENQWSEEEWEWVGLSFFQVAENGYAFYPKKIKIKKEGEIWVVWHRSLKAYFQFLTHTSRKSVLCTGTYLPICVVG